MEHVELIDAVKSAQLLEKLLGEEFEALKTQRLDDFDKIQAEKIKIIKKLSHFAPNNQKVEGKDGNLVSPDDGAWDEFMGLMASCKNLHLRNEILINRKLDATKGALHALQSDGPTSSVEVYDRLGKLSRARKKGGYDEV